MGDNGKINKKWQFKPQIFCLSATTRKVSDQIREDMGQHNNQ